MPDSTANRPSLAVTIRPAAACFQKPERFLIPTGHEKSKATYMDQKTEELLYTVTRQQGLKVHFQPIVHLQNRQIYGDEGLSRGLVKLDLLCRQAVIKKICAIAFSRQTVH